MWRASSRSSAGYWVSARKSCQVLPDPEPNVVRHGYPHQALRLPNSVSGNLSDRAAQRPVLYPAGWADQDGPI